MKSSSRRISCGTTRCTPETIPAATNAMSWKSSRQDFLPATGAQGPFPRFCLQVCSIHGYICEASRTALTLYSSVIYIQVQAMPSPSVFCVYNFHLLLGFGLGCILRVGLTVTGLVSIGNLSCSALVSQAAILAIFLSGCVVNLAILRQIVFKLADLRPRPTNSLH